MATPWKLITHKSDPWHVKLKKKVARWLWDDLTKLPKPADGYPDPTQQRDMS